MGNNIPPDPDQENIAATVCPGHYQRRYPPFPEANQKVVELFNGTYFAFLNHDLTQGLNPALEAGEGALILHNHQYRAHLVRCNYRAWENHDFRFTLTQQGDTLILKGIAKIDSLQVDHEIVETYVKLP